MIIMRTNVRNITTETHTGYMFKEKGGAATASVLAIDGEIASRRVDVPWNVTEWINMSQFSAINIINDYRKPNVAAP